VNACVFLSLKGEKVRKNQQDYGQLHRRLIVLKGDWMKNKCGELGEVNSFKTISRSHLGSTLTELILNRFY
jgi:hypothetical protein